MLGVQPLVAAAAREPLVDARTPLDRLRALFYGHLTALHGGGDEQAVVIQEWRKLSARARRRVVRVRDEIEAMWRDTLEESAAVKLVHGDLRLLRLSMLGALNWTLQWYQPKGPLGIRELAERLLAVFVPATGADRSSARVGGAATGTSRCGGNGDAVENRTESRPRHRARPGDRQCLGSGTSLRSLIPTNLSRSRRLGRGSPRL